LNSLEEAQGRIKLLEAAIDEMLNTSTDNDDDLIAAVSKLAIESGYFVRRAKLENK
jgi:hypothetical protein